MIFFSGELRSVLLLFSLCAFVEISSGLQCNSKSILSFVGPQSCPTPLVDSDKSFCCEKDSGFIYCCDFDEYAKSKGVEYLIPVISGIVIGILAGCFICCLCCPCCMLYKRRHRGTVYGRVQQPAPVVTVQTLGPTPPIVQAHGNIPNTTPMPMPMPMPMPHTGGVSMQPQVAPYPAYQVPTGDFSGQQQMPPPPYSAVATEGYSKQAPYNPNFYNN